MSNTCPSTGQINIATEQLITLAKAAREMPGGSLHVGTVHRWRLKGVRGVRLATIKRGGVRYTSWEALERFFLATTAAADGDSVPSVRTTRQRERAIEAAERELAEA
jgi:hypothetical protein